MTPRRPAALAACLLVLLAGACADTTDPAPPAEEVLVVVNSTEASLSIVPVKNPAAAATLPLGGTTPTPVGVSVRGDIALVPMGLDNSVAVVDLRNAAVLRTVGLPEGSGATGSAIVDDQIAYVANPNLNTVTRVNYRTGDTASVAVGVYPQALVYTRGRLFVVNGNLENFAPAGESWITVVDPLTNRKATGVDSIPLPGPGNAGFVDVGSDGLLYVMSSGDYGSSEGRLSIVDPVDREEVASFGGFGVGPGNVAAGTGDRLYVSSYAEGVMEFDVRTRTLVRGAGEGVAISRNAYVEVDSEGTVYALDSGPCAGGEGGTVHVLRPDLTEVRTIGVGECAVGAAVTRIDP